MRLALMNGKDKKIHLPREGARVFWCRVSVASCCRNACLRGAFFALCILAMLMAGAGCSSRSKIQKERLQAFQAGQMAANPGLPPSAPRLYVRGLVRRSVVPWEPNLRLSQALLRAEYFGQSDPIAIQILRNGTRYEVNLHRFLRGTEDPGVLAEDVIDVR